MFERVFLGGTCGSNNWREEIVIPGLLGHGVDERQIFNPVVKHWTPADQASEKAAKVNPEYLLLFVIAPPDPTQDNVTQLPGYSLVEVTRAVFKSPDRLIVLVDTVCFSRRAAKSIEASVQDWREDGPNVPIFRDYAACIEAVAARLRGDE